MDFLDAEAVESEDEDDLTELERKRAKRIKAIDSDDEDDEDDEERLQEELKDLIDDNPIEEDEDDDQSDDGSGSKRKRSDDEDFEDRLEDEDYDLIEENLGVKVDRRKRFRRLRQFDDDDEEHDKEQSGDDDREPSSELVDGSDREEDRSRGPANRYEGDEQDEYYSDEDDFIVDDDGRPIADRKKKKKPIFTDAALQEAQDIFGVDFDYDDFEKYDEEDYDEEDDEEDDYLDEEVGEDVARKRKKNKTSRKKPTRKSIFEIYEPSELKRGHFTDLDNQIRINDIPERMQLRDIPITSAPEETNELDEEAEWIYNQAFCKPTISTQECKGGVDPRTISEKGNETIGKIKKALDFIRNQALEVPFIAFYRKEYVFPELNINDLWKIYKFDGQWCQLKARKTALLKLFESMREYQTSEVLANPEAPIPDNVRIIEDEDIAKIKEVQTTEELKDVHNNFLLYYGHLIQKMNEQIRMREKEAARQERKQARKTKQRVNVEDDEESVIDNVNEDDEQDIEELDEPEADTIVKPAVRSGPYSMCRKAGIDGLAKRFGLKPEQFAENVRDNYQRNDVEQEPVPPLELAKEYCSSYFNNPEDVLKAAKFMVATQLAKEPLLRKVVRDAFFERARLSITPSKKGIKEIDENHPLYSCRYLKQKPVRDLIGVDFLRMHNSEEDKLLTVKFDTDVEGMTCSSFLEEMKQLYVRDEFSSHVQEWNNLRLECVEIAYKKMLIPDIIKELRMILLAESKNCILNLCSQKLYNWLKVAPYTVDFDDDDDDWDTSKGIRSMGIAFTPDRDQASFACLVVQDGECTDHLRLPHLLKRKNSFRQDQQLQKQADLNAIRNFIYSKKPHVICIGAECRDAIMIAEDVKNIVLQLVEDEQFPQIAVEILDNDLAKVYANSLKGESDFRDYPVLLRQAISLARRIQDPLMEFSQLCTSDDEIMCLRYHPMQDYISQEDLLDVILKEFINRTNEVGVDINEIVQMPYSGNLLQFVCGLGPRKAAALTKLLKQTNQRLENRTQLVTSCHMGPKIFINCAGFIKIDTNSLGDSTETYVEVLDGSRVHPETYEWARKMAVDALEYDEEETTPSAALEEILEAPERLKDLDLDAFAEELERQGFGNKSITLYDIRSELNCRYRDLRVPYTSPNAEELFDLLTKETPENFYMGKMVLATVYGISRRKPKTEQLDQANPVRRDDTGLWQCPFCLKGDFPELSEVWNHFDAGGCPGQPIGIKIRLDNGVSGYISLKNLSDQEVTNPEERVRIGQIIHCRIMKVDVDRFSIDATSKTSDLNDQNEVWKPPKDSFYDFEAEEKDKKIEENKKKARSAQMYVKRVIIHPAFHNISFAQAIKLMATMDQGDVIIRPSSKGIDHLTITWKVTNGAIYQHIDVLEKNKANAFSLGQSLWIDNEEFEDLDEIMMRYVNPMAAHARDLLNFRYYKDTNGGSFEKAEEFLKNDKSLNPNKIHYIISAVEKYPGKFLLSYLPRNRCRHEYITVTPEGYRFRRQVFETVGMLFRWFKEHYSDPAPEYTPMTNTPSDAMSIRSTPYDPHGTGANHRMTSMTSHQMHPHAVTPGGYGVSGYPATPYTPSQRTPFMTPYPQTPQHPNTPHYMQMHSHTPRPYQTPMHQQYPQVPLYAVPQQPPMPPIAQGTFVHPSAVMPQPQQHPKPSQKVYSRKDSSADWAKLAEEWRTNR